MKEWIGSLTSNEAGLVFACFCTIGVIAMFFLFRNIHKILNKKEQQKEVKEENKLADDYVLKLPEIKNNPIGKEDDKEAEKEDIPKALFDWSSTEDRSVLYKTKKTNFWRNIVCCNKPNSKCHSDCFAFQYTSEKDYTKCAICELEWDGKIITFMTEDEKKKYEDMYNEKSISGENK